MTPNQCNRVMEMKFQTLYIILQPFIARRCFVAPIALKCCHEFIPRVMCSRNTSYLIALQISKINQIKLNPFAYDITHPCVGRNFYSSRTTTETELPNTYTNIRFIDPIPLAIPVAVTQTSNFHSKIKIYKP